MIPFHQYPMVEDQDESEGEGQEDWSEQYSDDDDQGEWEDEVGEMEHASEAPEVIDLTAHDDGVEGAVPTPLHAPMDIIDLTRTQSNSPVGHAQQHSPPSPSSSVLSGAAETAPTVSANVTLLDEAQILQEQKRSLRGSHILACVERQRQSQSPLDRNQLRQLHQQLREMKADTGKELELGREHPHPDLQHPHAQHAQRQHRHPDEPRQQQQQEQRKEGQEVAQEAMIVAKLQLLLPSKSRETVQRIWEEKKLKLRDAKGWDLARVLVELDMKLANGALGGASGSGSGTRNADAKGKGRMHVGTNRGVVVGSSGIGQRERERERANALARLEEARVLYVKEREAAGTPREHIPRLDEDSIEYAVYGPLAQAVLGAIPSIIEIIPNVEPQFLLELVREHVRRQDGKLEVVVQNVLHHLLEENPGYPKVSKEKGKRKREADGEGGDPPTKRARVGHGVDYLDTKRAKKGGKDYRALALTELSRAFPMFRRLDLEIRIDDHAGLFVPTYLALLDQTRREEEQSASASANANADSGGSSAVDIQGGGLARTDVKGKARQLHDEEFENEQAWLRKHLDSLAAGGGGLIVTEEDATDVGAGRGAMDLDEDEDLEDDGTFVECGCCFSSYPPNRIVECPSMHTFCRPCILRYAQISLGALNADLACISQSSCTDSFSASTLRHILPPPLLRLYDRLTQQKELREAFGVAANGDGNDGQGGGLEECPFCDWACVIEVEKSVDRLFRCGNEDVCGIVSCRLCRREEHVPKSCKEVDEEERNAGRLAVENAMTKAVIRQCPRCSKPFIKEGGCNKMKCSTCGTMSCYICRQIVENYDHFNRNSLDPTNREDLGKCPLHDPQPLEQLHAEEANAAYERAVQDLDKEDPAAGGSIDHLKVDLPANAPPPNQAQVQMPRMRMGVPQRFRNRNLHDAQVQPQVIRWQPHWVVEPLNPLGVMPVHPNYPQHQPQPQLGNNPQPEVRPQLGIRNVQNRQVVNANANANANVNVIANAHMHQHQRQYTPFQANQWQVYQPEHVRNFSPEDLRAYNALRQRYVAQHGQPGAPQGQAQAQPRPAGVNALGRPAEHPPAYGWAQLQEGIQQRRMREYQQHQQEQERMRVYQRHQQERVWDGHLPPFTGPSEDLVRWVIGGGAVGGMNAGGMGAGGARAGQPPPPPRPAYAQPHAPATAPGPIAAPALPLAPTAGGAPQGGGDGLAARAGHPPPPPRPAYAQIHAPATASGPAAPAPAPGQAALPLALAPPVGGGAQDGGEGLPAGVRGGEGPVRRSGFFNLAGAAAAARMDQPLERQRQMQREREREHGPERQRDSKARRRLRERLRVQQQQRLQRMQGQQGQQGQQRPTPGPSRLPRPGAAAGPVRVPASQPQPHPQPHPNPETNANPDGDGDGNGGQDQEGHGGYGCGQRALDLPGLEGREELSVGQVGWWDEVGVGGGAGLREGVGGLDEGGGEQDEQDDLLIW
ncbi:hypothetical protein FA15DRAFT_269541 [Coprinopsis marcescibilis]|uniref:RING-type domain-containing protein n=1 Tax=Coprinopsis marcescibilis TaxID=230819 RepID=A0A5C3KEU9_COPMA|nr:hypothetical protein FA15DRAFT_269541 [Coprinopsis marcescibilis]